MEKEPRPKVVIRRTLRRPDERRAPGTPFYKLLGFGLLGGVVLVLSGPWFVFAPYLLALLAVFLHVRELERFSRPNLLRRSFLRLRLWLRGESTVHCPLCRDLVIEGEDPLSDCGGCAVRYHTECRDELGGCATLGCPERPARPTRAKLKV